MSGPDHFASPGAPGADHGLPLVAELTPPPDPALALAAWSSLPRVLLLDSAQRHPELGRYSFLMADPFRWIVGRTPAECDLATLRAAWEPFRWPRASGLPPFQGGLAGLWSYEFGNVLEPAGSSAWDEFGLPLVAQGLYDVVLAWDHSQGRAWLVSQGFPELEPALRRRRAVERLAAFRERLSAGPGADQPAAASATLAAERLAPQFDVGRAAGLTSNFSADGYRRAIERVLGYIRAGDVFQINLAQRLLLRATEPSWKLYRRLRECNPAPFAAYFDLGPWQVLSASPERFLRVDEGRVETRPIKGTRRRWRRPEADLFAGDELLASEKDRAENVMIVDLLRNDLSRVCRPDSVRVSELCRLENYEFVTHLVSVVTGELRAGQTALELVGATFPGGSITGAPKVRARQIIAELEPTARGAYCGALGYWGFDGGLDLNLLIRTITAGRGWWQAPVGGGIVVDSDPEQEYAETWHKAAGLLRAMRP